MGCARSRPLLPAACLELPSLPARRAQDLFKRLPQEMDAQQRRVQEVMQRLARDRDRLFMPVGACRLPSAEHCHGQLRAGVRAGGAAAAGARQAPPPHAGGCLPSAISSPWQGFVQEGLTTPSTGGLSVPKGSRAVNHGVRWSDGAWCWVACSTCSVWRDKGPLSLPVRGVASVRPLLVAVAAA